MSKPEDFNQEPDDIARVRAMLPIQKRAFKVANKPEQFNKEIRYKKLSLKETKYCPDCNQPLIKVIDTMLKLYWWECLKCQDVKEVKDA